MARIARALEAEDAATGLFDLALESPYPNPNPLTRAVIRALLDDAFHGRRPTR
jgi:hypothetical protein